MFRAGGGGENREHLISLRIQQESGVRVQLRPIADGHQGSEHPGCCFPWWLLCEVVHDIVDAGYLV